ncbi:MAG TPA: hypothetical protein VEJ63_06475 [Planctomycetota bacterium]|nr:hypothetical protein [Planctomycetota bacterium]
MRHGLMEHGAIGAPDSAFAPRNAQGLLRWIHEVLFERSSSDAEVQLAATMYVCLLESGFSESSVTFCQRAKQTYDSLNSDGDSEAGIKACGDLCAFVSKKAIVGAAAVLYRDV